MKLHIDIDQLLNFNLRFEHLMRAHSALRSDGAIIPIIQYTLTLTL